MKKGVVIRFFAWLLAVVAVAVVFAVSAFFYLCKPVSGADEDERGEKISVVQGDSVRDVSKRLMDLNLIRNDRFFYYAARFHVFTPKKAFNLRTGTYYITNKMSLREIYSTIQEGRQEYITVSIPEGLTKTQIGNLLEENKVCDGQKFIELCFSRDLLEKYHVPADSLEGYLYPDTYFFTPGMDEKIVIDTLVTTFFDRISSIPGLKDLEPEKLLEKLVVASIVEREYRVKDEAPLIASVFYNRIKIGMGLESCATIVYIITEIQGLPHPDRIFNRDLRIDSPYNTYKWAALPPGPISNPGLVSLNAVADPPKTNYYYFRLTNADEGRHTFSSTLDQHEKIGNMISVKK